MDVSTYMSGILKSCGSGPFLFIGSGFSRRYIDLDTWSDLLKRFTTEIKDFGYYYSTAGGDLPRCASLIARDFNEVWWNSDKYEESRGKINFNPKSPADTLKFEIANYLNKITDNYKTLESPLSEEVSLLSTVNVDGIITTNWDMFIDELFPDYKVFIGQDELMFANPQSIAEIYKIHGCASKPQSLVLTDGDYEDFKEKNPYLAAKLITIFVEHPVVFIGYSISDSHIQDIIASIAKCLSKEKLAKFENNLIFIDRNELVHENIIETVNINTSGINIKATLIKMNDFSELYKSFNENKRKIPARIIRYCKEQMYEIAKSNDPTAKIAVLDIDEISNKDEIEFVVGIGIAKEKSEIDQEEKSVLGAHGYAGVEIDDVFKDIISVESKFIPDSILRIAYPSFLKRNNRFITSFRYLKSVGISSEEALESSEYDAAKIITRRVRDNSFIMTSYRKQYEDNFRGLSTNES